MTASEKWYEKYFENYAEGIEKIHSDKDTHAEVDFIEGLIEFDKSKMIIDAGCGTGRHTIELNKRGYSLTGIDCSRAAISWARRKAREEHLDLIFVTSDIYNMNYENQIDCLLMLNMAGIGLYPNDDDNMYVIENTFKALRSGGIFIFTVPNALHIIENKELPAFLHATEAEFDSISFMQTFKTQLNKDSGEVSEQIGNLRYYTVPEIKWYLREIGFKSIDVAGHVPGKFSKNNPITPDNFELLVIARKK